MDTFKPAQEEVSVMCPFVLSYLSLPSGWKSTRGERRRKLEVGWGVSGRRKNEHLLSPGKFKGLSHVSLTPFIFPKTYQLDNHLSKFKMKQMSERLSNLLRSAQLRTVESELEARAPWFKTRLLLPTTTPTSLNL